MPIIDAQLHAYERDRPERPWHKALTGPPEATGEQTVAVLDKAKVDGAHPGVGVHDVPLRRQLRGRGAQPLSGPLRAGAAGRSRQSRPLPT